MSAPIPEELHRLRGTRPTRAKEPEVIGVAGKPKMPPDLPPVAAAEWKRIVKLLAKRGTLTNVDSSALETYCYLYAQFVDLRESRDLKERKLALQYANSIRLYQKEFGSTPASRTKVKPALPPAVTPEPEPDPMEKFLHPNQPLPSAEEKPLDISDADLQLS